ncbi:hypothetical protein SLS56_002612 [Neofusicoccum ribis]|uniref:Cupin 2 conserved barrel domain-containing protein n=1 Tax=Neofusicoccum ribis TaxID=45134 RepID=A0ABR3T385_9PEZI
MEMIIDHTAPEDSVERLALDTIYDGEPGSDVFQEVNAWQYHSEHMTVLEGRAAITLDGKTQIVQAGDPTVSIPARHTHSMKGFEGEKLVLRERPDPAGLYKAE